MKANLYRMPKDPGHLGGYYLTPTIVGFLGLLLTNVTATQYIAHHFEYQPALGEPLFRSRWAALYEPFAWASFTCPCFGREQLNMKNVRCALAIAITFSSFPLCCAQRYDSQMIDSLQLSSATSPRHVLPAFRS